MKAVYAGFFCQLSFHNRADPSPLKVPGTQEYPSFTPLNSVSGHLKSKGAYTYPNSDAYTACDVDAALRNTGPGLSGNLLLLGSAWVVGSDVELSVCHIDVEVSEILEDLSQHGNTRGWCLLSAC